MTARIVLSALAAACLVACADHAPKPDNASIVADIDVAALAEFTPQLVGVAVDPATGALSVLDAEEGLFELDGDQLLQTASPETLERDGADLRPFTDVAAMGDGSFSITVQNDGLLLDVEAQLTTQHFCYLPGGEIDTIDQGPVKSQLTHAVAYNAEDDTLYAQPQTFIDGELESAQVGTYSGLLGGQPEGWFNLKKKDFVAHGMVWDDDHLLLGNGDLLYTYTLNNPKPVPYADLSDLGVHTIQGLALRDDDTLVVVQRTGVLEISDWRIEQ